WAWILGALAFFSPLAVLGVSPKPAGAEAQSAPSPAPKPRRVIHRVVRRVIITQKAPIQVAPSVNYISGGGYSGGSSSGGSSGSVAAPVTKAS
ncbi:MAG: hypothetical protein MUP92_03490, partial [Actinobacteria bacterium]|nr:hypothetical protein [Actinomycetota bacterium]